MSEKKTTILIVEDNCDVQQCFKDCLPGEKEGVRLLQAYTKSEAEKILTER